MARNSENAPSEPSDRRRPPSEGNSRLREHFRESIRDALSGVDVDELQGRRTLRVPQDVSLLTREAVTGLEAELAALRAERAELERRAAERTTGGAVAAVVEAPPVEAPPVEEEARAAVEAGPEPEVGTPRRESRLPWRRARPAAVEVERVETADGGVAPVAWSPARAMEPVEDRPVAAAGPAALDETAPLVDTVAPAPQSPTRPAPSPRTPPEAATAPQSPTRPAPSPGTPPEAATAPQPPTRRTPSDPAAPEAAATVHPAEVPAPEPEPTSASAVQTAPPSPAPRRRARPRPTQLSDAELESVVAPLLAELANLRAEVRELRGDPDEPAPLRAQAGNRQLAKLAAGLLLGFALIVVALAVVLKA